MDLGYVLYENELKRSFWSTKTEYRRFLQLAVFKLILSKRYKLGTNDFINPAFSLQKSHIYLSRKLKNIAFTSHKSSHFPHGNVMK